MEIFAEIKRIWVEKADKRAEQWFILSSPVPILIILGIYYLLIKILLPAIFKGRKHLKFRYLLAIYYISHCALSAFYVVMLIIKGYESNMNLRCEPVTEAFDGVHYEIAAYAHGYLWYKISELLETILEVIVIGKVSAFVFFHHVVGVLAQMVVMHFYLGGSPMAFAFVNSLNHIVLYAFYSMHSLSEEFRLYSKDFFKRYHYWATIVYFSISFVYFMQLETREDCNYNNFRIFIMIILAVFSILSAFMRIDYIKPKKRVLPQEMLMMEKA